MLNWIWLALVLLSVVFGAYSGRMKEVSDASLEATKSAIELVIGLTGAMVFFLGLVRVASDGGLLRVFVRALRPILHRLFPQVPPDHPAMSAIVMNFASNMLGLGNAATPFGLKAMVELDRLNPTPGSASNAMALFLAINTSSIVLLPPLGTVAARVAADSASPFVIWVPTLIATICSTTVAVATCLALQRLPIFRPRDQGRGEVDLAVEDLPDVELPDDDAPREPLGLGRKLVVGLFLVLVTVGLGRAIGQGLSQGSPLDVVRMLAEGWLLPLLIAGFLLVGVVGRVRVYDAMVEAGKEGLEVAVRIAPYLVVILVAIQMFRASGALDFVISGILPLTDALGVPAEALPMALMRPLSGSGAFGVMASILETHGPDSPSGLLASTLMGSTETTFYVLAVYLGAVGIRDARHILPACLAGDLGGFIGATVACHLFFGM